MIRKLYKLKIPDSLIAATALNNDMVLIADNDKDFLLVPELKYKSSTFKSEMNLLSINLHPRPGIAFP